jgi:hypothetical protein
MPVPPNVTSSDASPPGPADVLTQVGWWTLKLLLWGALVVAGWLVGGPLALFGLSAAALVLAAGLCVIAATVWRRAVVPLALTAASVALSATLIAHQPVRVSRTAGLLHAAPATSEALRDGSPYRSGHGSVFLDLRHTALRPGTTTTVRAASGDGRISVALPTDRCVAVEVLARRTAIPAGVPGLTLAALNATRFGDAQREGWQQWESFREPDFTPQYDDFRDQSNLELFGRTVTTNNARPLPAAGGGPAVWQASHTVNDPRAPRLRLLLEAPGRVFVRDYPRDVGPAFVTWEAGQPEALSSGTQVADATWPIQLQLPPSPGDLAWADRWREHPTGSRAATQQRQWRGWVRRWVLAGQHAAAYAAGACSTTVNRSSYWSSAYLQEPGNTTMHAIAVNANGVVRVYRQMNGTGWQQDSSSAFAQLHGDRVAGQER